jgi:hypothetical protein
MMLTKLLTFSVPKLLTPGTSPIGGAVQKVGSGEKRSSNPTVSRFLEACLPTSVVASTLSVLAAALELLETHGWKTLWHHIN